MRAKGRGKGKGTGKGKGRGRGDRKGKGKGERGTSAPLKPEAAALGRKGMGFRVEGVGCRV